MIEVLIKFALMIFIVLRVIKQTASLLELIELYIDGLKDKNSLASIIFKSLEVWVLIFIMVMVFIHFKL